MRIQGRAKAGFYPTPPVVTQMIASYLRPQEPEKSYRYLDPCAGEGTALMQLSDLLSGFSKSRPMTFGIELDSNRAEKAKKNLSRCIVGDFFTVRTSRECYSMILLNPPYDSSGDEDRRLEHKFLVASKDLLISGGILILIIPQTRLIKLTARHLAAYYDHIKVFRFPDDEYPIYKQIVIFGKRKQDNLPNEATQAELERVPEMYQQLKDFTEVSTLTVLKKADTPEYLIPASPEKEDFYFRGYEIEPQEALKQVKKNGIWSEPHRLDEIFAPQEPQRIRPLMPLKKGHLALLIASGFINNQILDDGQGMKLIIKGRSFKTSHTEVSIKQEEGENGKTKEIEEQIEKEAFATTINAFDLKSGEFIAIR